MNITTEQLRQIIKEELESLMDESNIFNNIRKKKEYCEKNPSASKCKKEDRPSPENWKKATKNEEVTPEEEEELAKIKDELKGASKMHKSQSDRIKKITANENKKNCGCGQDPCKTYGIQEQAVNEEELEEKKSAAWQRKAGKNKEGGLNAKGRKSYEKENPGSDLKAPVSKKTADKNPEGEAAGRRKSFCARMKGMKAKNTGEKKKNDPDSRINKALRKWDC
jgi:hypothetical protein